MELAGDFSSRAARLTAGPMQVKSSRLPPPILPNRIGPTCNATPNRKRSTASPLWKCIASTLARDSRAACRYPGANLADIAVILRDRKHREQPVAHELQDFAAVLADRRHLAIEVTVENFDHGFGREPVRQRGKSAQVRQPDRRMHGLGMAAANLAAENALAGAVADIGVEQESRGAAQADDLDDPRQWRHHRLQCGQLLVAKSARLFGGPARGVDGAVHEYQRQRDIVGDALRAHVVDKGKTLAFGIVDPQPDLPPLAEHDRQRAVLKFRRILDIEIDGADDDLGARPPDKVAAEDIGMQRSHEQADAPERHAGRDQPLAQIRYHIGWNGRPGAVDQPVGHFLHVGCVHGGCHLRRKRRGRQGWCCTGAVIHNLSTSSLRRFVDRTGMRGAAPHAIVRRLP